MHDVQEAENGNNYFPFFVNQYIYEWLGGANETHIASDVASLVMDLARA